MKKYYTFLIAAFIGLQSFAQTPSLKFFTKKDKTDITNSTHTIYGDGARFVVSEEFYSVMTGVDSVLYGAKRIEKSIITGTADYYCWKECYIPKDAGTLPIWIATDSLMNYNNDTVAKFSAYFQGKNNLGMAEYRYVFTPKGFPNDTVFVDIIFDMVTVGLDAQSQPSIEVFPNPATDVLNISIGDSDVNNARMRLINSNGQVVVTQRIQKYTSLDVSNYESGLYLIEIKGDSGLITRKKVLVK